MCIYIISPCPFCIAWRRQAQPGRNAAIRHHCHDCEVLLTTLTIVYTEASCQFMEILFAIASELHQVHSYVFILEFWPYMYIIRRWYSLDTVPVLQMMVVGSPFLQVKGPLKTAEGAIITYHCSPGLVPGTQMSGVCINMTWRPDPANLQCSEYCI